MKILLHGCNGRMGQVLTKIIGSSSDMEVSCGVDINPSAIKNSYPVYSSLKDVKENVDVVIDFSNHQCIDDLLEFGNTKKTPLVICTTGFTEEEREKILKTAKHIAIFNSSNMSIGINLMQALISQAARVLNINFDIEIIEKHHNEKLDSPSGTALMLADSINAALNDSMDYTFGRHGKTEKRTKNEIGIHAIRGGSIVGEHEVIFAGESEIIEIKHTALSRDVFAHGAISAAKFMVNKKPGFYNMNDIIG